MLEKEIKTFEENKAQLKEKYGSGGFVVIKDETILGVWNDRQDALNAGIKEYGNVSFLVKDLNESTNNINSFSREFIFTN